MSSLSSSSSSSSRDDSQDGAAAATVAAVGEDEAMTMEVDDSTPGSLHGMGWNN
jgi:hypothetical protein